MITKIYMPAMVNPVITGLRLGMAITVIGVLVAELKFADGGLGYRLGIYYEQFRIAPMYAIILIIFALAAAANVGMTRLQDRVNRHMAPTTTRARKPPRRRRAAWALSAQTSYVKKGSEKMAKELFVSKADELADGDRKIVPNGNYEIGVYRVNGELFAYQNVCPHQGGPACEGLLLMAKVEGDCRGQDLSGHDVQPRRNAYRLSLARVGI